MSCSKTQGTWNDLEEMKYLLCAIECWYVYFLYYSLVKDSIFYSYKEKIFVKPNI